MSPIEKLTARLKDIDKQIAHLQQLIEQLNDLMADVDSSVAELLAQNWELQKQLFDNLAAELKQNGLSLSAEMKNILLTAIKTQSGVDEIRQELEKLGIKISDKASNFYILACKAIVASLGASLDATDDYVKKVGRKASELEVANDAGKHSKEFAKECAGKFAIIAAAVKEIMKMVASIQVEQLNAAVSADQKSNMLPATAPSASTSLVTR